MNRNSESGDRSDVPFVAESVSESSRRKRERSRKLTRRARHTMALYLGCVLLIGLLAGGAQFVTGLLRGLPMVQSLSFLSRAVFASGIGAFVGLTGVSLAIISPILPIGPLVFTRDPDARGSEQWDAEVGLLPGAGILCSVLATLVAATTIPIDDPSFTPIAWAGTIGAMTGATCSAWLLIRRPKPSPS